MLPLTLGNDDFAADSSKMENLVPTLKKEKLYKKNFIYKRITGTNLGSWSYPVNSHIQELAWANNRKDAINVLEDESLDDRN